MKEAAPRQNVTFQSGGGEAFGYLALPPHGHGPGIVLIQEWWGLDDHMVEIADRFASEGFVVLAPDLYGGRVSHSVDGALELMLALPVEEAVRALAGAVRFLEEHSAVTSQGLGAVGFCMGGAFALRLAAQEGDRIAAVVPFYAAGPATPTSFEGLTASVEGHFAVHDDLLTVEDALAQEALVRAASRGSVRYHFYEAGHAFLNDTNPRGDNYDPGCAAVAWRRAVEFLSAKLAPVDA